MHTCEFKTLKKNLFEPYRLSLGRKYFANDERKSFASDATSVITEKYYLSFQFESQNNCGEICSYSILQEYKVRPTYFKYIY